MMTQMFLKVAYMGAEWVLWVLLILSFVSVAIIVERFLFFRRRAVDTEELTSNLRQLLLAGDVQGAHSLVANSEALECLVVEAGLTSLTRGSQACGEAMLSTKAKERIRVDAFLPILGTIGSNAPFVGLLGTVLGIIKAAHDLAAQSGGQADPNAVMSGVFEALVATAVGLFVAIPAVVAFNFFQRKVRTTVARADSLAHLVLSGFRTDRKPGPQPAAGASR